MEVSVSVMSSMDSMLKLSLETRSSEGCPTGTWPGRYILLTYLSFFDVHSALHKSTSGKNTCCVIDSLDKNQPLLVASDH